MTVCGKCNEEIPAGKKFCANCGEKLIKETKSIEYEEYHLRKNKCTATIIFYTGVFLLGIGILISMLIVSMDISALRQELFGDSPISLLPICMALPGFFILSIGGFWAINSEYLLSQRLTKDFEASQKG
jgi:predicted nucleic acid-binding Zn ribbon protein